MRRRILGMLPGALLAAVLLMSQAGAALALNYYLFIKVFSADENPTYAPLAIIADVSNDDLADLDYISETGLDTRVTYGGSELPHLVADEKLAFAAPEVKKGINYSYGYTMGNDPLDVFAIIPGYDGYVTIDDNAALEPGNNFEIEQKEYIDTAGGGTLVSKAGAFSTTASSGNVTSLLPGDEDNPPEISGSTIGEWIDVDVSSYVGSGATGVILRTNGNGAVLGFRKNGSTDNRTFKMYNRWVAIGVDENGVFEYYQSADRPLYLMGYTGNSFTFLTNGVDKTPGSTATWTDMDCSSEAPGAVGLIFELVSEDGDNGYCLVRNNGSTDNYGAVAGNRTYGHYWQIIGCDGSQISEGYIEDSAYKIYLVGYITANASFETNSIDKIPGSSGSYVTVDCSSEAPGASWLFFRLGEKGYAHEDEDLRLSGSSFTLYERTEFWTGAFVECSGSQTVQAKTQDYESCGLYLVGYATSGIYRYNGLSVTATGVSSGEHTVKTTADGTDMKIFIDGVEKDSVALGGESVPNMSSDWVLMSNGIPYMEYYKHTVGGTLIAWYQPNDMISGTTLPDREGTAQDGTITWGSLPDGVTASTDTLHILNMQQIDPEAEEGAYFELFDELPPEPENLYEVEGGYTGMPGSGIVNEWLTIGQIPLKLFWVPMMCIVAVGVGLYVYSKTESIMGVAIAGGVIIGFFYATHMLPWWIFVPYTIMAIVMCVQEKTYGF